jgi:hypothetical protein
MEFKQLIADLCFLIALCLPIAWLILQSSRWRRHDPPKSSNIWPSFHSYIYIYILQFKLLNVTKFILLLKILFEMLTVRSDVMTSLSVYKPR